MSILDDRCQQRLAPRTMSEQLAAMRDQLSVDQHIAKVGRLLQERRKRTEPVAQERRGRNPQRRGFEDQSDIDFALYADAAPPDHLRRWLAKPSAK